VFVEKELRVAHLLFEVFSGGDLHLHLRASLTGRCILDTIYICLLGHGHKKCPHVRMRLPLLQWHRRIFYRKNLHALIRRKEREKDSIYVDMSGQHMDLPCIKGGERALHACHTDAVRAHAFLIHIWSTFTLEWTSRSFYI
jgi:hypothetical protein